MNETRKTLIFAGVAIALLLLAFATSPGTRTPDEFFDLGEEFFPEFEDPNSATTLEVVEYEEDTGAARPFKVTFEKGIWTIPSHHNYPADGKDRLAQTAARLIGLKKEGFRSSNVADHEAFGVVDPLDETSTSLSGRGERLTVRGASGEILADLIVGKNIGEEENMNFVRVPGQKRVYVCSLDLDISTNFSDWIETDLLQVEKDTIETITILDYSINERTRRVVERDKLILKKNGTEWKANKMRSHQEVNATKMSDLTSSLDELSIVGVRPKPAGVSQSLTQEGGIKISQEALLSLQSKGYYLTREGNLLSNEGELQLETSKGITYVLRFGEILYGSDEAISTASGPASGPGENRYLFITAGFNQNRFPEPKSRPTSMAFQDKNEDLTEEEKRNKKLHETYEAWKTKIADGESIIESLNERFAAWYYVISGDSFDKIHLKRRDLVTKKD